MKRTTPWALVILVVIGSLIAWESASGAADPAADRRYERTRSFSPAWNARCDPHGCEVPTLIQVPVATPAGVSEVDVTAILTFDYRTTPDDWGFIEAAFRRSGGPRTLMNPGSFPVLSPGRFASTSLVWVKRNVPAAGRDYTFEVSVLPRRGDNDPDVSVRGRRLSFVVDMTESAH
jgi:hypothetical protein